jgi:hypothetical protein
MGPTEALPLNTQPTTSGLSKTNQPFGDDEEDRALLAKMLRKAEDFLNHHHWCCTIKESYFGIGVGGVFAVFLFNIEPRTEEVDEWLWVVCGDYPFAYLTTKNTPTAVEALILYIGLMEDWVDAVLAGEDLSLVFPVAAPPRTSRRRYAPKFDYKLNFLREYLLEEFGDSICAEELNLLRDRMKSAKAKLK